MSHYPCKCNACVPRANNSRRGVGGEAEAGPGPPELWPRVCFALHCHGPRRAAAGSGGRDEDRVSAFQARHGHGSAGRCRADRGGGDHGHGHGHAQAQRQRPAVARARFASCPASPTQSPLTALTGRPDIMALAFGSQASPRPPGTGQGRRGSQRPAPWQWQGLGQGATPAVLIADWRHVGEHPQQCHAASHWPPS